MTQAQTDFDRRVSEARHLFLEGREIPDRLLPETVVRSWQRSRQRGLQSTDRVIFNYISLTDRRRVEEENRSLVAFAEPELQRLYEAVSSTDWIVACLNSGGTVVHSLGGGKPACRELGLAFRTGVDLSEGAAGTTGPSCALIEGRPMVISGNEHFLDEARVYSCAAVPIFDPSGRVAGALDASRLHDGHRIGILEPLALAARAVENRMVASIDGVIRLAVHYSQDLLGTPLRGVLAFSEDGELRGANPIARQLFDLDVGEAPHFGTIFGRPFAATLDALRAARDRALVIASGNGIRVFARIDADPGPARDSHRTMVVVRRGIADDTSVASLMLKAQRAFERDVPVLVGGETGTGKEVLARQLHENGPRNKGPFIAVNCSSIPAGLIESELFGYESGAFTGARRGGMAGKFEQANGGTLFLDEIGDMPLDLQARLLRVLQERELTRLGGDKAVALDFSLVCATHRDLSDLVAQKLFRVDLYYRINGIRVNLPPLRERRDIQNLIDALVAEEAGSAPAPSISAAANEALLAYPWPGNIRELRQVLRLGVALAEDGEIDLAQLPDEVAARNQIQRSAGTLEEAEAAAIRSAMQRHKGNVSAAARSLGVARATLYRKFRQLGLSDDAQLSRVLDVLQKGPLQ